VGGAVKLLHMIGNAHIDPVWLWRWPEGYQEVHATFSSALDRMDEYPEFVFTSTSAVFFQWVAEHDPALFERIRARVAEGRWEVVGGWWLEPDCNIPSGESFVRQALYGQRWLREHLGVLATTGANLDSFGHNAVLPQILARSGCDSYVFLRPGPHERPLPAPLFRWRAADGSSVAAYRIPHEYCSPGGDLGNQIDKALAQLPADEPELMVFYGVGNHGGGPTRANLDSIRRLDASGTLPHLRCSSPRAFFDAVATQDGLPEVAGDLLHHSPGCYSAHSGMKRWNRRAENLLQRAEKWSVVAASLGGPAYPLAELTEAWKLLLVNQFHDTLAGTSIAPAYDDARDQIGHASSIAAWAFNRAVQSVARRIDVPFEEGTQPLVVFNPHAWRLRADVELEFGGFPGGEARLVDDAGVEVPLQRTRSHATVNGPRGRIVFAADVPPLGYRVYRLHPGTGTYQVRAGYVPDPPQLENDRVFLELDASSGRIAKLVCKASGVNLADPSEPHAVVVDDRSDTWGHRVRAYDDVVGELEATSVRVIERGPVRTIVRVDSRYGASTLREDYVLSADAPYVDVRVTLDWHERLKLLKLRYPTGLACETATFQVPYGYVERPARGDEEPGQAWVDVSAGGAGLAVLNDAKHGFEVRAGDIGVTAVRSPVYAWHDPRELEEGGDFEWMDQGRQRFTLRLVPHEGDWRDANVVRLAAELNQPPFALLEAAHAGDLPSRASYADDGGGPVVLAVLKGAEDGDGIVARAYETAGHDTHAAIRVLDHAIDTEIGAHEIRTFHLGGEIREVNLLEWT